MRHRHAAENRAERAPRAAAFAFFFGWYFAYSAVGAKEAAPA